MSLLIPGGRAMVGVGGILLCQFRSIDTSRICRWMAYLVLPLCMYGYGYS